jgi:ABC-type multidrug transport system fused ATPase/permease subunit
LRKPKVLLLDGESDLFRDSIDTVNRAYEISPFGRSTFLLCSFAEATSALDNESQAEIQQAMEQISARADAPTIITVAHRLSTIRDADVIHVMDSGNVVESGSHEELVERAGRYWHLIESQV